MQNNKRVAERTRMRMLCHEAKEILSARGRWMRLVALGVLSILWVMLPFALSFNLTSLLAETPLWRDTVWMELALPYLLMLPTLVLITCPCMVQVMRGVVATLTGESPTKGAGYGRDLWLGCLMLSRALLPYALVIAAWCLPRAWLGEGTPAGLGIGFLSACATAALSVLWLYWSRRWFFVPYFAARGVLPKDACRRSRVLVANNPRLPMAYTFSFLGLIALSVLSLGVLLIFYALPLMWATYVRAASSLSTNNPTAGSNE